MSIYFNAASHGLPSRATLETFSTHIRSEIEQGTVRAAETAQEELLLARTRAARLLGAPTDRTVLGTTTTQAWLSVVARLPLRGKRVLVSAHEWGSNIRHLQHIAAASEMVVTVVPESEAFDPAAWARRLDEDVAAMFVPLVTSIEGLLYPVAQIGSLPRPDGTLLIVDAAQGLGRVSSTMADLRCDVLLCTARKWLRGPRATALMAISSEAEAVIGCPAKDLEPVDFGIAARCALGAAIGEVLDCGVEAVATQIAAVEDHLCAALTRENILRPANSAGHDRVSGTVVVPVPASRQRDMDMALRAAGIVTKWANPRVDEPLSQRSTEAGHAFLRITPHVYNTEDEIERVVEVLTSLDLGLC